MNDISDYLHLVLQAPIAIVLMFLIYKVYRIQAKNLELFKDVIKDLINKLK